MRQVEVVEQVGASGVRVALRSLPDGVLPFEKAGADSVEAGELEEHAVAVKDLAYQVKSAGQLLAAVAGDGHATADAAASLRRLNQLRARSKRAVSWRTLLSTFRTKNGERVGSGTWPRTSHNCLSSSRSILSDN